VSESTLQNRIVTACGLEKNICPDFVIVVNRM